MARIEVLTTVSIDVDDADPTKCSSDCAWCYDSWECRRFSGMEKGSMVRPLACIEEFGLHDRQPPIIGELLKVYIRKSIEDGIKLAWVEKEVKIITLKLEPLGDLSNVNIMGGDKL